MGFFRSAIGGTFKCMIDVPSWVGYRMVKDQTMSIYRYIKGLCTPQKAALQETFEQAVARLNLSETDIQTRAKNLVYQTLFFLIIAVICIAYVFYLFFHLHIVAAVIAILVVGIVLIKAFHSHFWYFQIKHRKLGCTFKEWISGQVEEIAK